MRSTANTHRLIGASKVFRETLALAEKYARAPWPILILGESGVGKEELARFVHAHSARREAPFLPVNCAALPAGLFESELFGHERGAFSGALQASKGILRAAHGGTVFLDEIGDLDPVLQAKLLRVLDSGEVRAVGATRVERTDFRLLAATNVNLHRAVGQKEFRADLLERIHVLVIEVPPLRARPEDIVAIAESFLQQSKIAYQPEALSVLTGFAWPTNVRQLINFLKRVVASESQVSTEVLNEALAEERRYFALARETVGVDASFGSLADIEKQVILQRLSLYSGNRNRTARDLGIAKSTLHDKLQRWQQRGVLQAGALVRKRPASHSTGARSARRAYTLDL